MSLPLQGALRLAAPALLALSLAACATTGDGGANAPHDVIRYASGPTSITSKAVEIPIGKSLIFVSGNTATPAQPQAPKDSPEYWGDTETQTRAALKKIDATLREMKLTMADVVKLQAFVVAPAGSAVADLAGFNKGYGAYFGANSQGKLPSRTAVQVAALGHPGVLIEIEVTAVRP